MTANEPFACDASNPAHVARAIGILEARINAQHYLLLGLFTTLGQGPGPFVTRAEIDHVLLAMRGLTEALPEPTSTVYADLVEAMRNGFHGMYGQDSGPSRDHLRLVPDAGATPSTDPDMVGPSGELTP